MASEMTKAIYRLLRTDRSVTAAGVAHALRNDFLPTPLTIETERSLEWLVENGFATRWPDTGFGTEYRLVVR